MQSTRAYPMSMYRAARNGNASFDIVGVRDRCEQLTRPRPLHVDLRVPGGHVRDERMAVAEMPAHPGLRVPMRGVGGDDEELIVVEHGHGQVGLERAAVVQPLGIGDPAGLGRHPVGRDPLELPAGVPALHEELGHERHVHEDHAVPGGVMLGGPVVEPVRTAPGQFAGLGRDPGRCVPVGAFPAADVAEASPLFGQPVVDRRQPRAPRGLGRPVRVVGRVDQAERLDRSGGPVLAGWTGRGAAGRC